MISNEMTDATTLRFGISGRALMALSAMTARRDVRWFLNYIHVFSRGDGFVSLEVCNGHYAVRYELPEPDAPRFSTLLDVPKIPVKEDVTLSLELTEREGEKANHDHGLGARFCQADTTNCAYAVTVARGRYPDVDGVMVRPEDASGEPAAFDPVYHEMMGKRMREIYVGENGNPKKALAMRIHQNGTVKPSAVTISGMDNLRAVIMPIRDENEQSAQLERQRKREAKEADALQGAYERGKRLGRAEARREAVEGVEGE